MKIRQGFVSNSSSSSFLCCVCNTLETGWDGQYAFETCMCTREHEFCSTHKLSVELTAEEKENCWASAHPKECPICMLKKIPSRDLVLYLLKRNTLKREDILKEIERSFKDYDEFCEYSMSVE
jgi:hypothetical protein